MSKTFIISPTNIVPCITVTGTRSLARFRSFLGLDILQAFEESDFWWAGATVTENGRKTSVAIDLLGKRGEPALAEAALVPRLIRILHDATSYYRVLTGTRRGDPFRLDLDLKGLVDEQVFAKSASLVISSLLAGSNGRGGI